MSHTKKSDIAASLTTCANGLTTNYPATQMWVFNTKTYKRGDILNLLQATIDAANTTQADHATWIASVQAETAAAAALRPVLDALEKSLQAEWGATSSKMAEFGFTPEKPRAVTAATKAASAAKARATRAAKKAALDAVGTPAPAAPAAPVPPKTA
jgi:hypothetical protein